MGFFRDWGPTKSFNLDLLLRLVGKNEKIFPKLVVHNGDESHGIESVTKITNSTNN